MKESEIALLEKHLDRVSACGGSYLEFGSGNSTRLAAAREGISRVHVVESDPQFFEEHVSKDPGVARAIEDGRLEVTFSSLGKVSTWGHPEDETSKHLWPLYPLFPFGGDKSWNLILVDGRFRVACCLAAALAGFAENDSPVMVHDFHHRPHYRILLRWLEISEQAATLVCLKKRPDFDPQSARSALEKYVWLEDDHTTMSRMRASLRSVARRIVK